MKVANSNGIANFRNSGEYVHTSNAFREENKLIPHHYWTSRDDAEHKRGLLVSIRMHEDWSLNVNALSAVEEAENSGAIDKGYVVLEDENGYVAHYPVKKVREAVSSHRANPGTEWGPFYYIDAKLNVVKPGGGRSGGVNHW